MNAKSVATRLVLAGALALSAPVFAASAATYTSCTVGEAANTGADSASAPASIRLVATDFAFMVFLLWE